MDDGRSCARQTCLLEVLLVLLGVLVRVGAAQARDEACARTATVATSAAVPLRGATATSGVVTRGDAVALGQVASRGRAAAGSDAGDRQAAEGSDTENKQAAVGSDAEARQSAVGSDTLAQGGAPVPTEDVAQIQPHAFAIEVRAGALAAGRLFRAVADASQSWVSPAGTLFGTEVETEIDENVLGGLGFEYRPVPRLTLGAGLSVTTLNLTAHVRSATDEVNLFDYDKATAFFVDATLSYDLVATRSTPYVTAGGGLVTLNFDHGGDLNQTIPHIAVGGGYRWRLGGDLEVTADVRDAFCSFDFSNEPLRRQATSYDGTSRLQLWQFGLAASLWF
jgi:hypothetical protein